MPRCTSQLAGSEAKDSFLGNTVQNQLGFDPFVGLEILKFLYISSSSEPARRLKSSCEGEKGRSPAGMCQLLIF